MKLLELVESQVEIGAPLPWGVRGEDERLLLSSGYVIQSERQREALLERGVYVDEDEVRALPRSEAMAQGWHFGPDGEISGPVSDAGHPPPEAQPTQAEVWSNLSAELEFLLNQPTDKPDLRAGIEALADTLLTALDKDVDVALYITVRQEGQQDFYYGYRHSVHVALLSALLARHLGWAPERVRTLVCAALTMNVAIVELQGQMAGQDTSVLDSQRAQLRKHPEEGVQWLSEIGVNDEHWLAAVFGHHERPDGTGYPQGKDAAPSESARVLRLVDSFSARISLRTLRPALSVQEAARQAFREDGGELSALLIEEIGVYPPGDLVRLKSGEIGIVMRRAASGSPSVGVITDAQGRPSGKTVLRDSAEPAHAIVGAANNKALVERLLPERFYGIGPA